MHLAATLLRRRDSSLQNAAVAACAAVLAMMIAEFYLPPVVDPVYGEGGLLNLPCWIDPLLPVVFWAIVPGTIIFTPKFIIEKAIALIRRHAAN